MSKYTLSIKLEDENELQRVINSDLNSIIVYYLENEFPAETLASLNKNKKEEFKKGVSYTLNKLNKKLKELRETGIDLSNINDCWD